MPKSFDLDADLGDLAREAATLREEIALYELDARGGDAVREALSKSGLASDTTKLYGGCERIMEQLAKVVDEAPIGGDGGWHAQLLRRMSQPYLDRRGAILSDVLFDALDRLRGFRHRERTSYGRTLDGSIVAERAGEMADAADRFTVEVGAFLSHRSGATGTEGLPD